MADGCKARAVTVHQRGQLADARRQDRFDAFAQPPRQNRRGSARADGHDHITAIDNRRDNKCRQVRPIDNIHRDIARAGPLSDALIERSAAGRNDRNEFGEIRLQRISKRQFEPACGAWQHLSATSMLPSTGEHSPAERNGRSLTAAGPEPTRATVQR